MASIRASGGLIGKPVYIKFSSQGVAIENLHETMAAVNARLKSVLDQVANATGPAMLKALQPIFDLSQQYVPVDTGDLKSSGFLELQSGHTAGGPRVAIGYGRGGRPWYAAYVHEATWLRHAKGKYAKYLERAVNERIHVFKALLQQEMKTAVGSRGRVG